MNENFGENLKKRFEMNGLDLGIRYTLSLSWIKYYPYKITNATDNKLSQTVSDNNIKYIIKYAYFFLGILEMTRARPMYVDTRDLPEV